MRKIYLIDRKYQVKLMLQIVVMVIVATSVSALATYFLTNREISSAFYLAHRDTWDLKDLLLPVITGTSLVTFFIVSIISAFITLRETHRIVGPMGRLKIAMQDLSEGRISWIGSLRKNDVMKGLDVSINNLADNLGRLDESMRSAVDDLKEQVTQVRDDEPLSRDQVAQIRRKIGELENALTFFKRD